MSDGAAQIELPGQPGATTFAGLMWPARPGRATALTRSVLLVVLGSCILTLSAKVLVPGPINMTLQTLAVLMLGAALGWRLALGSVLVYLAEGAMGLPVFTTTPPLAAGLPYLLGPTGGFLVGFAPAAAIVGLAADRGLVARPLVFAAVLAVSDLVMLALGATWLAFFAHVGVGSSGIGLSKAIAVGVQPFVLGEAIKVALAAVALPVVWNTVNGLLRR